MAAARTSMADERYRLLFDQNVAGVYRTTLDGKILDCNESLATMLGYPSREDLLTRRAQDLYFTSANRASFLARLKHERVLVNSELRLKRKDGEAIHVLENVMLLRDEQGRRRIIQGTMVDITERKRAEQALRQSERKFRGLVAELRRLAGHLQTVRDEERTRIARELHDELGHALTSLNMDLHWLRGKFRQAPAEADRRLDSMCRLMSATLQAVRRICADLRPAILDDCGLAAAIEWQTREFESRTGIRCRMSLPPKLPPLPDELATAVFRIFQESLTNIARHSRATLAQIALKARADSLVLEVRDNGVGLSAGAAGSPRSFGLLGMRERALRWKGSAKVHGRPGKGTEVLLRVPIPRGKKEPKA